MAKRRSTSPARKLSGAQVSNLHFIGYDTIYSLRRGEAEGYRFREGVRAGLLAFAPDVVRDLERAVGVYCAKEKHWAERRNELREALEWERRFGRRLGRMIRYLDAAPKLASIGLGDLGHRLREAQDGLRSRRGHPRERFRRELEVNVGYALKAHGIPLRKYKAGKLAVALRAVTRAVDPTVKMSDPMPAVRRVCEAIRRQPENPIAGFPLAVTIDDPNEP